MKLSEKILTLRKQMNLSQEELADRLNVSRQAVSRWEVGSAQPDASNILQLSRLFGVSADYLLNEDYDRECDIPVTKDRGSASAKKIRIIIALCVSAAGLTGNFIIYLLSRFNKVMVPHITYQNGEKWYHWDSRLTGYSYKYFIQTYSLEFLTAVFWLLVTGGLLALFLNREKLRKISGKVRKNLRKIHESLSSDNY